MCFNILSHSLVYIYLQQFMLFGMQRIQNGLYCIRNQIFVHFQNILKAMVECEFDKHDFLKTLGIERENFGAYYDGKWQGSGTKLSSVNPTTNVLIASTTAASVDDYEKAIKGMEQAKAGWFSMTMPARGEIVRQIGEAFRKYKEPLGKLISLEMGKIYSEGLGQVQEVIDICDMACGLSRTIGGSIFNSQRPEHFMMELWNPLGIVGVITAFNFPCAVFGWNAAIAFICGDLVVWKGAPTTSLITIASTKVIAQVFAKNKINPNVLTVVQGDADIGGKIVDDRRIPLISFTGSTKIGKLIQQKVTDRFGKCLLELGGNNCTIVMEDANLEMAFKACTFSAVGTCGQRCTTLRRLLVHSKHYDSFIEKLVKAYGTVRIGNPLDANTLCGPLHSKMSIDIYEKCLQKVQSQGGKILCGGKRVEGPGNFVYPTICEVPQDSPITMQEYFCPILFVTKFETLQEAIAYNNKVPQGLSSSLFTQNISNVFRWTGPLGSDCGIVNVNIGNSGAQIGGAFGGQKETGGGRQSGSDSWKQYMRRSTCTLNYGKTLPLAQGVNFDL